MNKQAFINQTVESPSVKMSCCNAGNEKPVMYIGSILVTK